MDVKTVKYLCSCDDAYTKAGKKIPWDKTEMYEVPSKNASTCDYCGYFVFASKLTGINRSSITGNKSGANHRYEQNIPKKNKTWKPTVSEWHKTDSATKRNTK